ncbi:nuclear transport factor 2 family protein [Agromyces sp. LHK192]|uniref:nuclear transport factor 2 family protein n=1 Tax=Agromyces sp. LHK192 TaxID=2498704 RepID=UPI000FD9FBDE|nr:nuclear transport factor 2 family protein [Agromyces sp. LHK192]
MDGRATIEALVDAINARDLDAMDAVFDDDVVIEWPQSRERIVGGANRRAVYAAFPGLPTLTPRRIRGSGELWVAEIVADYGDGGVFDAVFVFEIRDGRIRHESAYWASPFAPADWRAGWVETM